jgi:glycosyltransferase involved in cell wall biosynthesis
MPLVTVIIAHYHCENYLAEAVRSILRQTFTDLEVLLIDDGSLPDRWTAALANLGDLRQDERLRVYRTPTNIGNYAIKSQAGRLSDSRYIAFQDADDFSYRDRIAIQVEAMDRGVADILGTGFAYIDSEGHITSRCSLPTNARLALRLDNIFAMHHGTTMIARDCFERLGGFEPSLRIAGDYDFFLRASLDHRMRNLSQALYAYRIHPNALTQASATRHGSPYRQKIVAEIRKRDRMRLLKRLFCGPETARAARLDVPVTRVVLQPED